MDGGWSLWAESGRMEFQDVRNGQPDHHRNPHLHQPAPLRHWSQTVFRWQQQDQYCRLQHPGMSRWVSCVPRLLCCVSIKCMDLRLKPEQLGVDCLLLIDMLVTFYNAVICSIIMFGSVCWGGNIEKKKNQKYFKSGSCCGKATGQF